jgi:hypothetical protein
LNREQFQEYIDHFNNRRYDAVVSYFHPDVTVEYYDNGTYTGTPARTLYGRDGFVESYKALHEHTREVLELGVFMTDGKNLLAELYTEFHTFQDSPPTYNRPPKKKGDIVLSTNWVLYDLDENDKFKRIRIAHFRLHDPSTAKYK